VPKKRELQPHLYLLTRRLPRGFSRRVDETKQSQGCQNISFSPIFRRAFPLSLTVGITVLSGSVSVVFRLTVSPQTPCERSRLFMHVAKLQLATSQASSVHLHQTLFPRNRSAFFPHWKNLQFGEQYCIPAKTCTTSWKTSLYKLLCSKLFDK